MKGWLNYFYKLLVLVSLKRVGWRTEPCSRSKMISAFYWWSHSVSYFRTVIDKRRLSVRGGLQSGEHLPAAAALGRSTSATSGRLPASLFDLWHVNQRPLHDLCWRLSFLHSQENIRRQNPQSHLQSATTYVCTEHFQPAMRSLERIVALLPWCSSVRLFACLSVCLGQACIVIIRCTLERSEVYGWIVQCYGHSDTKTCPPTPNRLFLVPPGREVG